jgi:PIN domain nuclease of toxin-antitoxin system
MKIMLDTQILLWSVASSELLSEQARQSTPDIAASTVGQ